MGGPAEGIAFSPEERYLYADNVVDGNIDTCGLLRAIQASRLDARKHTLSRPENHNMTETQKVAIVTDAAGGIGRAMVRGLLGAGIRVAAPHPATPAVPVLHHSAVQVGAYWKRVQSSISWTRPSRCIPAGCGSSLASGLLTLGDVNPI